jgi:hypothetical protein
VIQRTSKRSKYHAIHDLLSCITWPFLRLAIPDRLHDY